MKPLHLFSAAALVAVALVVAALVISRPNTTDETSPEVIESSPTASPTQPVVVRVEQESAPEVGDEINISLRGIDAGVVATLEVGDELVAESAGSGTLTWTPKEAGLFESNPSADVTDVVDDDLVFALAFMLGSDEIQVSNSIGLPPDAFFQVISHFDYHITLYNTIRLSTAYK